MQYTGDYFEKMHEEILNAKTILEIQKNQNNPKKKIPILKINQNFNLINKNTHKNKIIKTLLDFHRDNN